MDAGRRRQRRGHPARIPPEDVAGQRVEDLDLDQAREDGAEQVGDGDAVGRIGGHRFVGGEPRAGILVGAEAPRRRRTEQVGVRARDVRA